MLKLVVDKRGIAPAQSCLPAAAVDLVKNFLKAGMVEVEVERCEGSWSLGIRSCMAG